MSSHSREEKKAFDNTAPSEAPHRSAFDMLFDSPNALQAVGVVLTVYLVTKFLRAPTHKLRHIPTIGSAGVLSSYIDAFRFFRHGQELIQDGYDKYYGTAFKVSTMGRWLVLLSGPQMVEDIRKASDDQISFSDAIGESLSTDYTIGPQVRTDPYHTAVVRTPLTRNLAIRFSDIKEEIATAFADIVNGKGDAWTTVPALDTVMQIVCRTSNRLFVGLPLCRNPDYIELNKQFTIDVVIGGQLINMFPSFVKPIAGRLLTKVPSSIRRAMVHLRPLIQAELDRQARGEHDEKSNDLISWLLDEAQGPQREIHDLVVRILSINFAAIHTTSHALTHALFHLAVHPEYVEPMREEVEAVIEAEGWTKISMGKMRKVDSFLRESQRLAIGALTMNRKVVKDFTFSNGVTLPAGTHIAVATHATHVDEEVYGDAHSFQGFRFVEKRDEDGENMKHQLVSLSPDYLVFGTGRHACPGRFFAANELKAMMAFILLNYDVKLPNGGPRPEDQWFQGQKAPNRSAKLMFRKRQL